MIAYQYPSSLCVRPDHHTIRGVPGKKENLSISQGTLRWQSAGRDQHASLTPLRTLERWLQGFSESRHGSRRESHANGYGYRVSYIMTPPLFLLFMAVSFPVSSPAQPDFASCPRHTSYRPRRTALSHSAYPARCLSPALPSPTSSTLPKYSHLHLPFLRLESRRHPCTHRTRTACTATARA